MDTIWGGVGFSYKLGFCWRFGVFFLIGFLNCGVGMFKSLICSIYLLLYKSSYTCGDDYERVVGPSFIMQSKSLEIF